jgi:hypothetical protein
VLSESADRAQEESIWEQLTTRPDSSLISHWWKRDYFEVIPDELQRPEARGTALMAEVRQLQGAAATAGSLARLVSECNRYKDLPGVAEARDLALTKLKHCGDGLRSPKDLGDFLLNLVVFRLADDPDVQPLKKKVADRLIPFCLAGVRDDEFHAVIRNLSAPAYASDPDCRRVVEAYNKGKRGVGRVRVE